MKWLTAVGQVRRLAEQCAEMAELPIEFQAVPVTGMWAVEDVLGRPRELDWVKVALVVDLPASEVPWFCHPQGAAQWSEATRLSKNPVGAWWRSAHVPVWNHRIVGPPCGWRRVRHGGLRLLRRAWPPTAEDLLRRL